MDGIKMYKTKYTILIKKLKDGDLIETDGIIEGLTTNVLSNGQIEIGGVVRDTAGEVI